MFHFLSALLGLCALLAAGPALADEPTPTPAPPPPAARLLAAGRVPHDALDAEGETLGAFGSGLACDGTAEGSYLAVADRGPGDGGIDFRPRFHHLRVERDADDPSLLRVKVAATTILLDAENHPMSGLVPDAPADADKNVPAPRRADGRTCVDPEGIVAAPDGTIYVADEYGPFVYQFARDGHWKRTLRPPDAYLPRDAGNAVAFGRDDDAGLAAGRSPNRGFEGLALAPDGRTLTALLQSPLVQDGGKGGGVTRLLVFDVETGQPVAEYADALESGAAASERLGLSHEDRLKAKHLSACELHAVDRTRYLCIERDNRGLDGTEQPETAADKSVWLLDTTGATNLLALPGQAYTQLPKAKEVIPGPSLGEAVARGEVKPVGRKLFIDLARAWRDSGFAVLAGAMPEKWEGLALRPVDGSGRYTLLVATDNDFLTPTLHLHGRGEVAFPKARRPVDTFLLLFEVTIPE